MRRLVLVASVLLVSWSGHALFAVPPTPTSTPPLPKCANKAPCIRVACGGACAVIFDKRLGAQPKSVLLTLPDFSKATGSAGAHIARIGWYGSSSPTKKGSCQYADPYWLCDLRHDLITLQFAPRPVKQSLMIQQPALDHVVFANQLLKDDRINSKAKTLFVGSLLELEQGYVDAVFKNNVVDHWVPRTSGNTPDKPASGVIVEISLPPGSGNVTVGFGANSVTLPYDKTVALSVTLTNLRAEPHDPRKVGEYYPDDDFGLHCSVLANCPYPFPIPFFKVAPLRAKCDLCPESWEGGDCFVAGFDGPGVFTKVLQAVRSQANAKSMQMKPKAEK